MQLIPAIDLRGGRVVRLERGDDARRTVYDADPAAALERFAGAGVALVHVVDLDAAFGEAPQRRKVAALAAVAADAGVALELGGGLRSRDDIAWALDAGISRLILGSLPARDPQGFAALVDAFPGRLIPAVEVAGGALRVAGWTERSPVPVAAFAAGLRGLACPAVLVTDVERDGTLAGPNLTLACEVGRASGLPALLSGGVRDLDDLAAAARRSEIAGAIVGKALWQGVFTLEAALATVGIAC